MPSFWKERRERIALFAKSDKSALLFCFGHKKGKSNGSEREKSKRANSQPWPPPPSVSHLGRDGHEFLWAFAFRVPLFFLQVLVLAFQYDIFFTFPHAPAVLFHEFSIPILSRSAFLYQICISAPAFLKCQERGNAKPGMAPISALTVGMGRREWEADSSASAQIEGRRGGGYHPTPLHGLKVTKTTFLC